MKFSLLRLFLAALLLAVTAPLLSAQDEDAEEGEGKKIEKKGFRTFTGKNGKSLELRVVSRIDDDRYTFETPDGKSFTLDVTEKLSEADQLYLQAWEPDAILDIATADLKDVLAKMGYSGADLVTAGNTFVVSASIGGKDTKLVIDAGRNFSTLDPSFAKDLGITLSQGTINFRDATGKTTRSQQGRAKSIAIGDVELEAHQFQVLSVAAMFRSVPANTNGAIGSDLLNKLNALLDYQGKRLYVRDDE